MLVELQTVDETLYHLEQDHQKIPIRAAEIDEEEKTLSAALSQSREQLETTVTRRKELENEVDSFKARHRKAENRLMGSTTQREYRAANAEIEEAKDSIKGQEEILLELMERQEALEALVTKRGERMDEFKAAAKSERGQLTKRSNLVGAEIKRLDAQRGGLLKGVDKNLLAKYDFIRKNRQGVALAACKDGTCLGCNMDIPPQQFNELQRMDRVMTCPSCQRLLYWSDAEGFEQSE